MRMGRKKKEQKPVEWVGEPDVQALPQEAGETLTGEASVPTQIVTKVLPQEIGTLAQIKARTFAKLVKEKGIVEAAKEVGERQWKQFISREEVREAVKKIIEAHYLPPDARKMLVRAGFNQLAIEGLTSTDPMAKKVALDALKGIAADQEVGITQPAAVQVSIDLGALKGVLESSDLPDVDLDGEVVEAIVEEKK